jgi:glutamate/tyrosine decarboxylase-like PLP-dependent enzyme
MRDNGIERGEETLDPADWNDFRRLGHRMLDDMTDYLEDIRSRPRRHPTEKDASMICVRLTEEGEGDERTYQVFRENILPNSMMLASPRFWGLVGGQGSAYGMMVEMLRAGMNGAQEFADAEALVNTQVISWVKEMLGYPAEAGGVLVAGGSEANFTGLAVARNAKAEVDVKAVGVQSVPRRMTLYCSEETHLCLDRSVELLGLGKDSLRRLPVDDEYRIRVDALERAIAEDRREGLHPFCLIGCAGTTNTGSFDDLEALAAIARRERMWFHVDGAFGAWAHISRTHRHLSRGMEKADSLAVDFHKWMNMPYGIGCTLVRDRAAHFATFAYGHEAEYLRTAFDVGEDHLGNPHNLALPLSRNFSSLKAYMLLRSNGTRRYADLVQQNIDQAHYLAELIGRERDMRVTAPVASNIVCFRYAGQGLGEEEQASINRAIMDEVNKREFMMFSDTTLNGRYMLRACFVNHRTRKEDVEYLVRRVGEIGRRLEGRNP